MRFTSKDQTVCNNYHEAKRRHIKNLKHNNNNNNKLENSFPVSGWLTSALRQPFPPSETPSFSRESYICYTQHWRIPLSLPGLSYRHRIRGHRFGEGKWVRDVMKVWLYVNVMWMLGLVDYNARVCRRNCKGASILTVTTFAIHIYFTSPNISTTYILAPQIHPVSGRQLHWPPWTGHRAYPLRICSNLIEWQRKDTILGGAQIDDVCSLLSPPKLYGLSHSMLFDHTPTYTGPESVIISALNRYTHIIMATQFGIFWPQSTQHIQTSWLGSIPPAHAQFTAQGRLTLRVCVFVHVYAWWGPWKWR